MDLQSKPTCSELFFSVLAFILMAICVVIWLVIASCVGS